MINLSAERRKLIEEIKQIPENQLEEIYHLVHSYRIEQGEPKLDPEPPTNKFMEFAGAWEDMPDEEFNDFLEEIRQRRKEAFVNRRER